jgi:Glycosyltransferase family 87
MPALASLGGWWSRLEVAQANRLLQAAAALWLVVTIPLEIILWPTNPDFPQFYLGGVIARHGEWASLYPIPWSDLDNPGLHSNLTPTAEALRQRYDVPNSTRFILPPPTALLLVPLSLLTYQQASWAWCALLIACTWGVAYYAGRFYRLLSGRPSRGEGVLALLIVLSPMVARAIRVQNTLPVIALMLAWAVMEVHRHDRAHAAMAILLGALLKYATLVLLPIFVLMHRWRTLGWLVGLGLTMGAGSLAIMGTGPFATFLHDIAPTLNRPGTSVGNLSLAGLFMQWHGSGEALPRSITRPLVVTQLVAFGTLLTLMYKRRQAFWRTPSYVCAAAVGLLTWMLIFSPITWEHYPIVLCPFWGWLMWEAQPSMVRRLVVIAAMGLMNVPQVMFDIEDFLQADLRLPEPWQASQLWGMMLTLGLATWRLAQAHQLRLTPHSRAAPPAGRLGCGEVD